MFKWVQGHFWSVAKVVFNIRCASSNSNLESYLIPRWLVAPGFPPKTLILLWFRNLPPLLNFMSNESARFIENKVLFFYHSMYRILNSPRINMIMKTNVSWSLQKYSSCSSDKIVISNLFVTSKIRNHEFTNSRI